MAAELLEGRRVQSLPSRESNSFPENPDSPRGRIFYCLDWPGSLPTIGRRVAMERVCPLVDHPGRASCLTAISWGSSELQGDLSACDLSSQACVDPKTRVCTVYWTAFLLGNKPFVCYALTPGSGFGSELGFVRGPTCPPPACRGRRCLGHCADRT